MAVERKGHLVLPYSSYRFGLYLDLLVGLNLLAVGDLRGRRTTIMEIGAGWGGFAAVVKRKFREARYIILDIPSSSVFQMSLLHQLGFKRIFSLKTDGGDARRREQLQQLLCCTDFDILFLSPSQFGLLPDNSVDVTVNFDSLAEMSRETISLYVQNISRVSQVFYHQQKEGVNNAPGPRHQAAHAMARSEQQLVQEVQRPEQAHVEAEQPYKLRRRQRERRALLLCAGGLR